MNHTGANRLKVRGRSCWRGFTVIFDIWSSASWRSSYPLSCHRCHIFSLHIPKADCSFLFLFFFLLHWIVRGNESRAKNIITQRVTLGERVLATGSYDGVPWLVSYHGETKGLWNHRKQNNQSRGTFQEKQHATETQHDPGRCCVWMSDEWVSVI